MIYARSNLCSHNSEGLPQAGRPALPIGIHPTSSGTYKKEVRRPEAAEHGSAHREGWDISFFAFSPLPYRPEEARWSDFCLRENYLRASLTASLGTISSLKI